MHKSKDGKVIASLTEVKNKTGDIFALVDKFGEVSLTSYNKIRYKILKVDYADQILEELPEENVKPKRSTTKEVKVVTEHKETVEEKPKKTEEKEAQINIKVWDRFSKSEKEYASKIRKPLIN